MTNIILKAQDVKLYSKYKRNILNYLISLKNKHQIIYASQSHIALVIGCEREWVCKMTSELREEGWITKVTRKYKTCLYELSSSFSNYWTRQGLKQLLPACAFIPASMGAMFLESFFKSSHNTSSIYLNIESIVSRDMVVSRGTGNFDRFSKKRGERVMNREILDQIITKYGMTDGDRARINEFDDDILKFIDRAVWKLDKINNKIPYFIKCCTNEKIKRDNPQAQPKKFISDNFGIAKKNDVVVKSPSFKPWKLDEENKKRLDRINNRSDDLSEEKLNEISESISKYEIKSDNSLSFKAQMLEYTRIFFEGGRKNSGTKEES